MKNSRPIVLILILFVFSFCGSNVKKYQTKQLTDSNGYQYKTVTNDPMGVRLYTLENGLKVYLSINKDEPRIQTFVAVRAGSTYDPAETTGLAHYLEHMMFKGTTKIGTSDWEKEKVELQKISDLYEKHKNTKDEAEKKQIYSQIDSISAIAAEYAIPNEYDKLVGLLGASGTNAWTSNEETVYMNNIPSNELEKWTKLESERFGYLVLRLFHTELETVYEEFNMSQDNDSRKQSYALMAGLFPTHQYGTQTTLGKGEHLKNPSMVNIHNYWSTYYVPNNMAVCMSGDLDFEKTVLMLEETFGKLKPSDVPEFKSPVEKPITNILEKEVVGPDKEIVKFAYRFKGIDSDDKKYVLLIDYMLNNATAGLIDLNLVQKQKVIAAGCGTRFMKHYGMHQFYGMPREGQTMEEVKDLILGEIDKIKTGEFEDWLMEAVVNNLKLNEISQLENNWRAYSMVKSFINNTPWVMDVKFLDDLESITKEDLVNFAKEHYQDNYVVVYKRNGKDTTALKVDKPQISPVPMNRDNKSVFFSNFEKIESKRLSPVFIDFKNDIKKNQYAKGIEFFYVENTTNDLFSLSYIIDMGKKNIKELPIAVNYLPYLGTDKYSPSEFKQELYKLGISLSVQTGKDRSYITISGLEKSLDQGLDLLEHLLASVKADQEIYSDYVDGILKKRSDSKLDKGNILWGGMLNYGRYGKESSFTDILSEEELKNIDPSKLTQQINEICSYEHKIMYYGKNSMDLVQKKLWEKHKTPSSLKTYPEAKEYKESDYEKSRVYFVDYDMVQSQILMLSKDQDFNAEIVPEIALFNEYFGSGLSSIVFQEIREAKGLAYSAYSGMSTPSYADDPHLIYAFMATQADKIHDATDAMKGLLNEMPKAEIQFNASKESIIKKIETERIIKTGKFWTYIAGTDRGLDYDIRKDTYETMKTISMEEFDKFFNEHVKGKNFTYLVLGNREKIDQKILAQLGEVKELTLEEIFNY